MGKENSQDLTVGQSTNTRIERDQNNQRVQADRVETVVVNEIPTWVILLLIVGWLMPSPGEMWRTIRQGIFRRSK